ncbi:hypothetical protein QR685DRAFT_153546 [Neurospora intermedia]|uniref:Uncharacterized protein n=1 Tax=Neurospora intermedia TaxID=5142 RepID=A0ABR3DKE1_NEUIN
MDKADKDTGTHTAFTKMRHTRLVLDIYLACTRYHAFLQPDTSWLPFFRFLTFHLHPCALARHFSEHSNLFPSFFCSHTYPPSAHPSCSRLYQAPRHDKGYIGWTHMIRYPFDSWKCWSLFFFSSISRGSESLTCQGPATNPISTCAQFSARCYFRPQLTLHTAPSGTQPVNQVNTGADTPSTVAEALPWNGPFRPLPRVCEATIWLPPMERAHHTGPGRVGSCNVQGGGGGEGNTDSRGTMAFSGM